MSWADREWDAFAGLIEEAWPGEFTDEARTAWRVLLDDLPPAAAVQALKRLLHRGGTFRPSAAELIAEAHRDPSMPTFEEAWLLVQRAIRRWADNTAVLDDLAARHPVVRAFAERQGIQRLRMLPVGDPEWGEKHLRDLRDAWDRHCEARETRRVAALAAGRPDGLRQLDPLASIIGERPALVGAEKGDEQ